MGRFRFCITGEIISLDGEVMGRIHEGGEIRLEDETLRANVLHDLRQQVDNNDSLSWPENALAAAQLPTTTQTGTIRLACVNCDTDEADGIDELPSNWDILMEIQTVEDSLQQVDEQPFPHSVFDWYTHLGICPCCREIDE